MRWEPMHVQRTRAIRESIGRLGFVLAAAQVIAMSSDRRAELERDRARLMRMLADAEKGEAER